jgi:hypothetical protein
VSVDPQFVEAAEFEDFDSPKELLLAMEATLIEFLEEEKTRIEEEVVFLKDVYSGITGGEDLEGSSGLFADLFLLSTLAELGFV